MKKSDSSILGPSFLDGFSLAGFMTRLKRPGAPTLVFTDRPNSPDNISPENLKRAKRLLVSAGYEVAKRKATGNGGPNPEGGTAEVNDLWGAMRGTVKTSDSVDLTLPTDESWVRRG
jgi:hypothetical protein